MSVIAKTLFTIAFVTVLCFAISNTDNESWLTAWFLLFFFVGIPLSLLVIKDLLVVVAPRWLGPSQILLHVCALFASVIGYGLGLMAINSEHEKAHLHQLLVIVFPLIVYATPLLMIFHGTPISRVKEFYFKSNQGDK